VRQDPVLEAVVAIIRGVFNQEDLQVTSKTSAVDVPEWDSFKMIEIIVEVEKRFEVKMETRDMDHIHCVGDMVLRVSDKIAARASTPTITNRS
jgi:acyl carrier protein